MGLTGLVLLERSKPMLFGNPPFEPPSRVGTPITCYPHLSRTEVTIRTLSQLDFQYFRGIFHLSSIHRVSIPFVTGRKTVELNRKTA